MSSPKLPFVTKSDRIVTKSDVPIGGLPLIKGYYGGCNCQAQTKVALKWLLEVKGG